MSNLRQHPVAIAIRDAAYFGTRAIPSNTDLDALRLSPDQRRDVLDACHAVAEIHDTGHQQDAWNAGDEAAHRIITSLPDDQQDHASFYREPDPLADVDDPIELAARIPRF